jgi:hypothetical protein
MSSKELLDVQVVYQNGRLQRVRRWWRGIHPETGTITQGWTGWETLEEKDCIRPMHVFVVKQE